MDVAGDDDLVARLAHRENHALHGRSRAADHEEGVLRAEGVGRQILGLADDGDGMAEVVEGLHGIEVQTDAPVPEQGGEFGIAPAALVAGYVEGHDAALAQLLERVAEGGGLLSGKIHGGILGCIVGE